MLNRAPAGARLVQSCLIMPPSIARGLPSVDALLRHPLLAGPEPALPRPLILESASQVLDEARQAAVASGAAVPPTETLAELIRDRVSISLSSPLRRVINATGIVIHTNLGRAPLSRAALEA